jgi:hypothetical protein
MTPPGGRERSGSILPAWDNMELGLRWDQTRDCGATTPRPILLLRFHPDPMTV